MRSIFILTCYEYVNRKIFIVSIGLYTLASLVLIFGFGKKTNFLVHPYFLSFLFYFSLIFLLLSSFDTVSQMVVNGSLVLILSRPVSRARLLTYQYIATIFILPISTFIFLLFVSFLYFVKTGVYDFAHIRVFAYTFITFAIYGSLFLPVSLLFSRPNVNLLLCLILIVVNVIPNFIYWITVGKIELGSNYIIGLLYMFSPRLVELCGLAVRSGTDVVIVFTHSVLFISGCLLFACVIIHYEDF